MTRPGPGSPVIGLDIDGTSGDYHAHFTWFMELFTGRPMPDPTEYTGGVPFYKHLGVSRSTYRTAKLAYRQGGMKRCMPVYEGIGDFTRYVRSKGVQVWICTTRPYLRLDNIDPDTRHWITKRAHMQYDAVLYGEHKYRDLAKSVGVEQVVAVFDDLPEMIDQALSLGLRSAMRVQPYNHYFDRNGNWCRVGSVDDMRVAFDDALDSWRRKP